MKRLCLFILVSLLLFVACAPSDDPADTGDLWEPIALPSAEETAKYAVLSSIPTTVDDAKAETAVAAKINTMLAKCTIAVTEPAVEEAVLTVSYLGILQEPLTDLEQDAGVLKTTVTGECTLAVTLDSDALLGAEVGDTQIALNLRDPSVLGLDGYGTHTMLIHVDVLAMHRAPKSLEEIDDITALFPDYDSAEALTAAVTAEVRGELLWSAALNAVTVSTPSEALCETIAEDFVESFRQRHAASGTDTSFSDWLSLHTAYRNEDGLKTTAASYAPVRARELLAACAVLDALGARESLPAYEDAVTPIANQSGLYSARYWSWQNGGSTAGWRAAIRAHCMPLLAAR